MKISFVRRELRINILRSGYFSLAHRTRLKTRGLIITRVLSKRRETTNGECVRLVTPSCLPRRLISKRPGKRKARDEYVTQSHVPEVDRDAMYVRSNKNDKKQRN